MKKNKTTDIGDIRTLKKDVSSFSITIEKGDTVRIVGIGERGYDIMYVPTSDVVYECGWDIFEG